MLNWLGLLASLFRKPPVAEPAPPPTVAPEPAPEPPPPAPQPEPRRPYAAAIALIGAAAVAVLNPLLDRWESNELVPYQDVVKIWTNCRGNTKNVDPNKVMTPEECDAINEEQLIAHAKPVLACVPGIEAKPNITAAAVSLAYNIGPRAFCRSTVATKFRQGDWAGGCDGFLAWKYAGGRVVKGLENRRRAEREICRRDL